MQKKIIDSFFEQHPEAKSGRLTMDEINQLLVKYQQQLNNRPIEDSIPYLWPLKQYLIEDGLVKKQHNSLSLTKKGDIYLKQNKQFRFKHIFNYFSNRFHWGNFYDPYFNETCGQLGWAFSMILVSKYGDKTKDAQFYSNQIFQALGNQSLDVEKYNDIYAVRFFEFFCSWFGLIDYEIKRDIKSPYHDKYFVKKRMLFDKLFVVKMN